MFPFASLKKNPFAHIGIPLALVLVGTLAYAGVPRTFSAGQPLRSADLNDNFSALSAQIDALAAKSGVPTGTVEAWAGDTGKIPAGWVLCDGRSLDKAQFPALFDAIGFAHGGNGASAFSVPDLRGRFLRGVDNGSTRDPGRDTRTAAQPGGNVGNAVGTVEADSLKTHTHGVTDPGHSHAIPTDNGAAGPYNEVPTGIGRGYDYAPNEPTSRETTGISINAAGSEETRPVNVAVNFIIKT
jgi:microcystin-dependent protein